MSTSQHPKHLAGWKQIASYLGVSEPTARRYYRALGLPVDDRNGRYFARPEDLDYWSRQRFQTEQPTPPDDDRPEPHARSISSIRQRRIWPIAAFTLLATLAVLGILAYAANTPGPLHRIATEGTTLLAFDSHGRLTWRKNLDELMPSARTVPHGAALIEDFDGDDLQEIAVTVLPDNPKAVTSQLLALDHDGSLLWAYENGGELVVDGRRFAPTYTGRVPTWLETQFGAWILNIAHHSIWYPSQVTLLDPQNGETVLGYWHPGRVYSYETYDVNGNGRLELLLGAINNPGHGIGHPSLAVLPLPHPGVEIHTVDTFFHEDNPRAVTYLLFPTYDVFAVQSQGAGVHLLEAQRDGRLLLGIGVEHNALVHQFLTPGLEIDEIHPSDGFLQEHRRLYLEDLLDHPFSPDELQAWRQVFTFDTLPDANSPEVRRLLERRKPDS